MKKVLISLLVVLILLGAAGYCGYRLYWNRTHVTVGGIEYSLDISELDLSGRQVPYIRELPALQYLTDLDLRDTGLTEADYLYLRKVLPNCRIQWSVPFQGGFLPEDTETLTVASLSPEDIRMLSYLPQLKVLDGLGCEDTDTLLSLKEVYPQVRILYQVSVEGTFYPWDTRSLVLKGSDISGLSETLKLFPLLESVTLTAPVEEPELLSALLEACPSLSFGYSLKFFDLEVSPDTEYLDLSGIAMENTETLESFLPHLPHLTKVDMVDCGISDEEMAALNSRWPNTLFVWEVAIGHFKLRTDITYFMPYQYRYVLSDKDADQLKYLTELICLDFGHMNISRTDYLAYMPKLQYLLICDTPITDLSPCAGMQELKYAEFFMTDVTDYSPLLECPNLVDLNICYTYPKDPLVFAQMTQLENLWFRGMYDETVIAQLKEALPNTRMVFHRGSSTGAGWRDLPNYFAQRDILGMGYMTG